MKLTVDPIKIQEVCDPEKFKKYRGPRFFRKMKVDGLRGSLGSEDGTDSGTIEKDGKVSSDSEGDGWRKKCK